MTRIEKLISELCPDGVEYKKLGEVCEILDSQGKPISKSQRTKGKYPYYGANGIQDYVDDYIFDGTFILVGEDGSVMNEDNSPVLNWVSGKIWVNNHAHVLAEISEIAILRYLYYALSVIDVSKIVKGNIPKITQKNLHNIIIPLPPLPVQEEIVKILDKFTELEAELEAKLKAELEARKKKYEYYRNKLLTPVEVNGKWLLNGKFVEWKKLREVFRIKNGYTPSTNKKEFWENGSIPWFRMDDIRINGRILNNSIKKVTKEAVKDGQLFPANSIIISTSATIGEHALVTVPHLTNQRFTSLSLKDEFADLLNIKFLYYYFFIIDELCRKNVTTSNFASVDMSAFRNFPIPPLEEQERIVAITGQI